MEYLYLGVALFLLATLILGLRRVIVGPTRADRMLAAQLFGTTGVAVLLLLGHVTRIDGVADVALVFALLAVVNVYAFRSGVGGEGGRR